MIKASIPELQLHYAVLASGKNFFSQITNFYSEHLLSCLNKWYGASLYRDPSLAYEAVYESIRQYCERPRRYNPADGSLVGFLEISADRVMQQIFSRENFDAPVHSIEHRLANYFDNERDIQLAKQMMENENDVCSFVTLLDIGSYRIEHQLAEISRHKKRISKMLHQVLSSIDPALSSIPADNFHALLKPLRIRMHNRGRRKTTRQYQRS